MIVSAIVLCLILFLHLPQPCSTYFPTIQIVTLYIHVHSKQDDFILNILTPLAEMSFTTNGIYLKSFYIETFDISRAIANATTNQVNAQHYSTPTMKASHHSIDCYVLCHIFVVLVTG